MTSTDRVQQLEAERLRPVPRKPDQPDPMSLDALFRELLTVIAAECARAGMLPKRYAA